MTDRPNIILASGSAARAQMLQNAGVPFEKIPADIDEQAIIEKKSNEPIATITEKLAASKSLYVSAIKKNALVIGSDQTLEFNGALISKSKSEDEAFEKLKSMSGKTHFLHSAVCVSLNNKVVFSDIATARLQMHDLNENTIRQYMKSDPDALTSCVGGYKIEGHGAWLFREIHGDNFTIMGMPLLPLLSFLRKDYKFSP